jgi:mannosyltransferase
VAAGLVLHDLGSRSLWLDEGFTYTVASQHGAHLLPAALKDGGNMIAYYLGLHYWLLVFGSSAFWLRLPTALAAIGTVPVCYGFLLRLFDRRAAVLGAFFVAVSVGFVWWGQNARGYVVATFFVCAAMLAFLLAVQTKSRLAWAAYVALTALAVYSSLLSALVVGVQAISLCSRRRRGQERAFVGSIGAMAVMMIPLVWVFADHGTGPAQWAPPPGPIYHQPYLLGFLASSRSVGVPFGTSLVDVLTVLTVLCWALGAYQLVHDLLHRGRPERAWGNALVFGWFLVPPLAAYLISELVQPVLSDRYILDALPPASMTMGVALSRLRPWPAAAAASVAVVLMRAAVIIPGYGVPLENWRQAVVDVAARSHHGDCIAFFVADGYPAFDYYVEHMKSLPGPVPTPVLPESSWASRAPYALDPEAIPPRQMPEVVASCPRLWLVFSHDSGQPPGPHVLSYQVRVYRVGQKLGAEVVASYRQTASWRLTGMYLELYDRRGGMTRQTLRPPQAATTAQVRPS